MRRLSTLSFALLSLAATAACRGDDDGGDGSGSDGGIDAPGGEMTIQDVQNDATPAGTAVTLRGVVVVAIDNYGPRKGNFYVMEPEGGEFSGVLVFGAPLEQVSDLAVGDLVDITGAEKDEFSLDTDDKTVTELGPVAGGEMSVVKVGDGTVPAPHVIDALTVGRMAVDAREDEYEKWEGVLVTVNNVSVTSELRPVSSSNPDPTFVAFSITGVLEVDSSLAEIPYSETPPRFVNGGDCLMSVTGMGDYFFNYKVLPRSTSEISLSGTGCPAAEAVGTCTDGIDNDANGFTDCADRGCGMEPTCFTDTTISDIQMAPVDGMGVVLNDVVVVGRDTFTSSLQGIWVAESAQAAPYEGIYVFTGNTTPDAAWTIGSLVDVRGRVDEFDNEITEITQPTITAAPGGGTSPTPLTNVPVPTLTGMTEGEPYEGVLVRLASPMVTNNAVGNGRVQLTIGGNNIIVDDEAYQYNATNDFPMGMTLGCITGVMHWNTFDNYRTLVPRNPADIVAPGGGCP